MDSSKTSPAVLPVLRARLGPVSVAAVAAFGGLVGAAWDLLHVRTGAIDYGIGPGRQPRWVVLEFALVYAFGVAGIVLLGSPQPRERPMRRLLVELAWMTAVYGMTAVLHEREWLVAALAAAALLIRAGAVREAARANPVPAIALVVGGPLLEAILIGAGIFSYAHSSLGNVPVWLPLLYANAVPFAVRLAEAALVLPSRRVAQ